MASGHVNRTKRPNTWLHRPMLQDVKKSSCQPGRTRRCLLLRVKRTSGRSAAMSPNDPLRTLDRLDRRR